MELNNYLIYINYYEKFFINKKIKYNNINISIKDELTIIY